MTLVKNYPNNYPNIFKPIKIGNVELKNRLQFAPMVSAHADTENGRVTQGSIDFIGAQARTGVGLITIGSTPVEFSRGRDYRGCLSVASDYDLPGLMQLAEEAHKYGAKLSVELQFAGRIADPLFLGGAKAIVPSLTEDMDPNVFAEVTKEEIEEIIGWFASAAKRVKEAGFDMVMLHYGHGNFASAFFSPVTNKRTDEYGGSLEKRMTYGLKLAKAVREAVGPDFGIEFRISQNEYLPGSPTWDDIVAYINAMAEYVDIANLSGGSIWHPYYVRYMMPSFYEPRCLNVEAAKYIKPRVKIPVAVVGNIPDIDTAEQILADGTADIITSARLILPDYDILKKARTGRADEIRPCLHCLECVLFPNVGHPLRCALNPYLGRETEFKNHPEKAPVKKKVMVIGGGPAGMMAAQTCAKRGHDVTLYEAADHLGGRWLEASALFCKDYHRRYLDWDVAETYRDGVKVVLNTKATKELVEAEDPDVLFVAIGAEHLIPPIKGIDPDNVINVSEVDLKQKEVGKKVIFCGAGLSAAECAFGLVKEGHECVLIDKVVKDTLYRSLMDSLGVTVHTNLEESGIDVIDQATIKEVGKDFVVVEREGKEMRIEGDSVVMALGLKRNQKEVDELSNVVMETYVVGDASSVGNIRTANTEAFDIAIGI